MEIKKILNEEIPIKFNLMLYELFRKTNGFLILQETEETYDLTFKIPMPKDKMYKNQIGEILDQIIRFKGK